MRYSLYINQDMAIKLGITNINLAHIFDLLTSVSTWAETEIIDGDVYYWIARQKISKELSILSLKSDTIYRHLKKLNELGLLDYIKVGKKDCVRITKFGKKYFSKDYVGNESEKDSNSEMNPSKFGNESEKDSDLNPTYNTTKSNPNTNDNKKQVKDELLNEVYEYYKANIKASNSKQQCINNITKWLKDFSKEELLKAIDNYMPLAKQQEDAKYIKDCKNFFGVAKESNGFFKDYLVAKEIEKKTYGIGDKLPDGTVLRSWMV